MKWDIDDSVHQLKNWATFKFIVASLLVVLGCYALMAKWHLVAMFFILPSMFMRSRSEWTRPIPRRESWIAVGVLIALVLLLIACKWLVPTSWATTLEYVFQHPAFVVPFGMLFLGLIYRNYQRQKTS